MEGTKVSAYLLSLKIGGKLIKGLETTGLQGKANFEELLLKEMDGVKEKDFDSCDWTFSFSGKTVEMDSTESATHEDFETLRVAMNTGASLSFVYGRMAAGEKVVSGTCVINSWGEDAGSEKTMGTWSGQAEVTGDPVFGIY